MDNSGGSMFLQRFMRQAWRSMVARRVPAFALATWAALALATVPARAQPADAYPVKPVVLVVAFAAGGGTDIMARTIARGMEPILGQPILIENKPGAGGNIGTTY